MKRKKYTFSVKRKNGKDKQKMKDSKAIFKKSNRKSNKSVCNCVFILEAINEPSPKLSFNFNSIYL